MKQTPVFPAGLDGVYFECEGQKLIGGFYRAAGDTPRPTTILLHGLPGIEKHLDIAYQLRDAGWNCLYFHFRGCWGSSGNFSLQQLEADTHAAIQWIIQQPSVDTTKIILIGASTGSYPAFRVGVEESRVAGVLAISPLVIPEAFIFPEAMAEEFSRLLTGITGKQLVQEWLQLQNLSDTISEFLPRPTGIIAAGQDTIFPSADYRSLLVRQPTIDFFEHDAADHSFSQARTWLVQKAVGWLREHFK